MSYFVFYDTQPREFLKKLDKQQSVRIVKRVNSLLSQNPVPHDAKPIVGEHGVFRIRIGDYRALYRINHAETKVIVFKIDKRDKVYQ